MRTLLSGKAGKLAAQMLEIPPRARVHDPRNKKKTNQQAATTNTHSTSRQNDEVYMAWNCGNYEINN